MRNMTYYASRPRADYGSKEDVNFLTCINKIFKSNSNVLAEGHDFKYVPSIDMYSKIDKIVSKVDKVIVLHKNGIIDLNQYYEVSSALFNKIPVLAININGRITKKVEGFQKLHLSGFNKKVVLKLVDVLPN
jgi:hypothetical protein